MKKKLITVAIADDHTILRKGVIELINSFGDFEIIIEATNGQNLIEKFEEAEILPNVCILDINMPILNGYETAKTIKERWPAIKILALSMYNNEYSIIQMLRHGAHGYILKDSDPSMLRDAIWHVHHHSYYCSELVTGKMIFEVNNNVTPIALNQNEMNFLSMCGTDLTYKEMGEKLKISPRTIESFRDSLFYKLNVKSRASLVVFANNIGLNQ